MYRWYVNDTTFNIVMHYIFRVDGIYYDRTQQQRSSALFLLKLIEERRLTQVAIDDVVTGVVH